MSSARTDFDGLVAAIYDAAFDASLWPALLAKLEAAIGGYGTGLFIVDLRSAAGSMAVSTLPREREQSYNDYYHACNPWLHHDGRSFLLKNPAALGESVISPSEMKRTEFYQDWLRPQGMLHTVGSVVLRTPSLFVLLSSLRARSRGAFTARDLRLLTRLRPHLQRAVEAQRRNAADLQNTNAAAAALDLLPQGWIIFDAQGRMVYFNAAAKRMMGRGGVDLNHPDLRTRIGRVAKTGEGEDLALPRRAGRPLALSILPLQGAASRSFASGTSVGILISDPDRIPAADTDRTRRYWKLTRAEAALAAELMRGVDVAAAAERLGIARTTARNQLRSVLNKTGAHRQSELIRLLLAAPPQIERE